MIARAVALTAAALLIRPAAAAADPPIGGITIGAPIGPVAQLLGPPGDVASLDAGHRFTFGSAAAYVDDDGVVLAVDTRAGSPRIDIDGAPKTFAVGDYTLARADAELAGVAEFAEPGLRSYRLAPRRDLVLSFSASTNRLERIAYGEPGQLARLGLLPGDAAAKAVPYRAPVLRRPTLAPGGDGAAAAVYRLEVDRAGAVTRVSVVIPSAQPASDADAARQMETARFTPAQLGGRPIASTVFVEVHGQ